MLACCKTSKYKTWKLEHDTKFDIVTGNMIYFRCHVAQVKLQEIPHFLHTLLVQSYKAMLLLLLLTWVKPDQVKFKVYFLGSIHKQQWTEASPIAPWRGFWSLFYCLGLYWDRICSNWKKPGWSWGGWLRLDETTVNQTNKLEKCSEPLKDISF